jgi:hypothetical protein
MDERSERAQERVDDLVGEAEEKADRLEKHGDEVADRIDDTREQWKKTKADPQVPTGDDPETTDFREGGNPAQGEGGPVGGD